MIRLKKGKPFKEKIAKIVSIKALRSDRLVPINLSFAINHKKNISNSLLTFDKFDDVPEKPSFFGSVFKIG